MSVAHIAFIAYPVTDLARAVSFYRDVLGLQPGEVNLENWVEFEIAGTTFGVGNYDEVGTPGTAGSLGLEVTDLKAFREVLAGRGVATTEPFELPGCWVSNVKDPDGNDVLLHQLK